MRAIKTQYRQRFVNVPLVVSFGLVLLVACGVFIVRTTHAAGIVVSSVSPGTGLPTGGTPVTITGSGFLTNARQPIKHIAAGSAFSVGLDQVGNVYTWGQNTFGQLGNNTGSNSSVPVAVATTGTPMEGKTINAIAAGSNFTIAVDSNGAVYGWGLNTSGQLGNGVTSSGSLVPVAVTTAGTPMAGKVITAVSAGTSSTLALASDGTMYAWGANGTGQLGDGTGLLSTVPVAVKTVGTPMAGKTITAISSGDIFSIARASDGTLYAWGGGSNGRLGNGSTGSAFAPIAVTTAGTPMVGKTITAIAAGGGSHTIARASDGTLYSWGLNTNGQLGDNTIVQKTVPVAVISAGTPMAGRSISAIGAGVSQTLAIASNGPVYSWGLNTSGQLGTGNLTSSSLPIGIATGTTPMNGKTIIEMTGGTSHSLALDSAGEVYAWGMGANGQLGDNTFNQSLLPVMFYHGASAPTLKFGGNLATNVTVVSDTQITATTPAHAVGAVDVTFNNGSGVEGTLPAGFTYSLPATVPTAPRTLSATGTDTSVHLQWLAPASDGGTPLTSYTVEYKLDSDSTWTSVPNATNSSTTTYDVTGLTPNELYDFRVYAVNAVGTSPASNIVQQQLRFVTLAASGANVAVLPSGGSRMSSSSDTVIVRTNSPNGYTLGVNTLLSNNNMNAGGNNIPAVSGTPAAPGTLTGSMWGFRVDGIGGFGSGTIGEHNVAGSAFTWAAVPVSTDSPATLRTTTDSTGADTTKVWYGISSTGVQTADAYQAVVLYTAVAN